MGEAHNPLGEVVAKALQDEAFKQELIADPAAVLAAEGVSVPEGVTLKVVADTAEVRHMVLPALSGRLSDVELAGASAAGCAGGPADDCVTCGIQGGENDWR